jgi:hypothetical protein
MQDPQTATWFFFGPVAVAYLSACGGWLLYDRLRLSSDGELPIARSDRPVLDFLLTLAAAGGILLLGTIYRQGWLLPAGATPLGRCFWVIDNAIIYSPIAVVLAARRQGLDTIFLSHGRLWEKTALGLGLGIGAVSVYLALRGELAQLPDVLISAAAPDKLIDFPAVFLEGVALAFGFVRFRWLVGTAAALVIPALLFAAAHVPGQVAEERAIAHMAAFFVFNSGLCAAILWTVQRSRDIVWIGLVHYLMDVAIRAI